MIKTLKTLRDKYLPVLIMVIMPLLSSAQINYTTKPATPTEFATLAAKKLRLPPDSLGTTDTGSVVFVRSDNHIWLKDSTGYYVQLPNASDIAGGAGTGSGISQLGANIFGLIKANDSTYKVDSTKLWTKYAGEKARDSLATLIAAKGNVFNVGTPTANQIAIWTDHHTIKGIDTAGLFGSGGSNTSNLRKVMYFPRPTFGSNLNSGMYFYPGMEFGSSFYQFWFKAQIGAEYFISDGYGGSHVLLFGTDGCGGGVCHLTGNMFVGGTPSAALVSLSSFPANTWHHAAASVVYNSGTNISTYYVFLDGVPEYSGTFTGRRKNLVSSGCGVIYIGGSDHSNFKGSLAGVQFNEYFDDAAPPIPTVAPFYCQKNFDNSGLNVSYALNLTDDVVPAIDRSTAPFYNIRRDAIPSSRQGNDYPKNDSQDSIPYLISDSVTQAAYLGGTTSGSGEKIYDYFERQDKTPAFVAIPSLDSTQGGSLARQPWVMYQSGLNTYAGIINKKAYFTPNSSNYTTVTGNSNDQDIRIGIAASVEYGCYVIGRWTDENNKIYARWDGDELRMYTVAGGVQTMVGYVYAPATTLTNLRLEIVGTDARVYINGSIVVAYVSVSTVPLSFKCGFGSNSSYNKITSFQLF